MLNWGNWNIQAYLNYILMNVIFEKNDIKVKYF